MIELDFVSNLGTPTHEARESLDSNSRINREIGRSVGQSDSAGETCRGVLAGNGEIVESNFPGDEETEGAGAGLQLRAEQSVQSAEVAIHEFSVSAAGEGAGEIAFEVVGHFGFQLNAGAEVEGRAAPQPDKILGGWNWLKRK
jgi:hypothetical protein